RPVAPVEPAALARLLTDLDNERFETRDRAAKELRELDRLAVGALRQALAGKPSAEVRRGAAGLLARAEAPRAGGEWVGVGRALETLEGIGSAEARRVLDALAGGAPEARLIEEARAAVARLNRRMAAPR